MITRLALLRVLREQLTALPLPGELESIYRLVAEHLYATPYHQLYLEAQREATVQQIEEQARILSELATGKPIQYVLGEAYFYDRPFIVTVDTLIPRPETEELCSQLLKKLPSEQALRGLDLCTGSGCIAITLALENKQCTLDALELSHATLEVAKANAQRYGIAINFLEADLYTWEGDNTSKYDFIISNPPYIPEEEATKVSRHVYDFEPHLALFVASEAPLQPYERIAYLATRLLKRGGCVACEIYEDLGKETAEVFSSAGLTAVSLQKDFWNKERFIFATKP